MENTAHTGQQRNLFQNLATSKNPHKQEERAAHLLAIGGGKGGVGKTLVSANLAITLAKRGKKVIAVDLDLGGANLHTCLGAQTDNVPTMTDFIDKKVSEIKDVIMPTFEPNLSIISGAQDAVNVANLAHAQKQKLMTRLKALEADYIILDLGAGTTFNTLDFFLFAQSGILVILPEPTSVENAYRFIKSAFYRRLRQVEKKFGVRNLINDLMDQKAELKIRTPADLLRQLEIKYPDLGSQVRESVGNFDLKFVLNQTRTQSDAEIGWGIRNVCRKYFGIEIDYLGNLEYDSSVWQSVRRRRPLAVEFPHSPIMPKIAQMAASLEKELEERLIKVVDEF